VTFGATHADVEARLSREPSLTSTTTPTDAEVDAWVAEGAAFVRQSIRAAGVTLDPASGSDGERICRALVVNYALARTLEVLAFGEDASVGSERAVVLIQEFNSTLSEWRSMGASALGSYLSATGTTPSTTTLRSHVTTGGITPPEPRYTIGGLDRSF
jgi:hypothetical protein